jgi:hypothetical protein
MARGFFPGQVVLVQRRRGQAVRPEPHRVGVFRGRNEQQDLRPGDLTLRGYLHVTTKLCRAMSQIGLLLIWPHDVVQHNFIVFVNRPLINVK